MAETALASRQFRLRSTSLGESGEDGPFIFTMNRTRAGYFSTSLLLVSTIPESTLNFASRQLVVQACTERLETTRVEHEGTQIPDTY